MLLLHDFFSCYDSIKKSNIEYLKDSLSSHSIFIKRIVLLLIEIIYKFFKYKNTYKNILSNAWRRINAKTETFMRIIKN